MRLKVHIAILFHLRKRTINETKFEQNCSHPTTLLHLFVEEVECELESDGLHVRLLEGGGDVHVHVEEALHRAAQLRLLDLQLRQQVHEPLERPLKGGSMIIIIKECIVNSIINAKCLPCVKFQLSCSLIIPRPRLTAAVHGFNALTMGQTSMSDILKARSDRVYDYPRLPTGM